MYFQHELINLLHPGQIFAVGEDRVLSAFYVDFQKAYPVNTVRGHKLRNRYIRGAGRTAV